jgi:RES domain-containing protein
VIAWRLATTLHPPLTGDGARRRGGRWNSPGVPLVYASSTLSLAVLEMLVHVESTQLPVNLAAIELRLPDDSIETLDTVPEVWFADPSQRQSRRFGDAWASERRSVVLRVPSAVVPREHNLLINPVHPRFADVEVVSQQPFRRDARLA